MSMTKRDFIALADTIKAQQTHMDNAPESDRARNLRAPFTDDQILVLAIFCESQNPRFDRERWLGYIAGTNGKNGGKVGTK